MLLRTAIPLEDERLIGSIRRECLDHMIVFGERSLHRALTAYARYYHSWRTHLSLGKDTPESRRPQDSAEGKVVEFLEPAVCITITNAGPLNIFDRKSQILKISTSQTPLVRSVARAVLFHCFSQ